MSKKGIYFLYISFFFLSIFSLSAQTTQGKQIPLISVLKILETRYQISFSYADTTVDTLKVIEPSADLTLQDVLDYLKLHTQLDFELLDDRFVTIRNSTQLRSRYFKTQRLNEVFITNYLTAGISRNKNGSISIQSDKLGILPGLIEADILQTIQFIPGVMSSDERISNITVRGGTHDQNLMLWDGIKMYQSGHFFGLISAFNPYLTKQVNVSKNGTSAQYGDGISSVIDMQLSNTLDQEFKAGIGFNLISTDVFAKIPLSNKMEVQLSARRALTDVFTTPTYDQYFKRIFQDTDISNTQSPNTTVLSKDENFYFYDMSAKFLYDITEKDNIRINFLNVYNNLNYDESSNLNGINNISNSQLIQENLATGIEYTRDWNARLSTRAQFYISNYNLHATNSDIINNQRLIQVNEVYDGTAKLSANYYINKTLNLDIGYQFSEVGISNLEDVNNPGFKRYIKEVIRSHSPYIEGDFLSTNLKTKLKFGSRFNYIQKLDAFLIEPRLSFSQGVFDHFRIELLGEFKSQTSTQIIDLQNDFLGIEKRRWILANEADIPIVKSKQASIGVHFKKNNLLISAESYMKQVNGISARSQGFQNQFQLENDIGKYDIKGIDFLIHKQFNQFNSWLSYSYSKNDYTFDQLNSGQPFPNNVDIRHTATFAGTYSLSKLKLALGLNWHSGKPITLPESVNNNPSTTINYATPNQENLSDYLRADVSATYNFNISNGVRSTLGISIWNLFDTKNTINAYYILDENRAINKVENQSLGITPNLSYRIQF